MTRAIADFVFDNFETIAIVSCLVLLMGIVVGVALWDRRASIKKYFEHRREIRIERGIEMGRKQEADRKAYLNGFLGEGITDFVEEAWLAGKITRDECNWCYRKMAARGVADMLPQKTQAQLKSILKSRRYRGNMGNPGPAQEHPAWGEPPQRPAKPDVQDTNVINAKKRFGEKALSRLKKSA